MMRGTAKQESHSESHARKPRYKAGREKSHSKTHLPNPQQLPDEGLTKNRQDSDGKQRSVLTDCSKWLRENWVKLVAAGALVVSIVALGLDCGHTRLEDAYTILLIVDERINLLEEYSDSLDANQIEADVEDAIGEAERFRNGALSAMNRRDIDRSLALMMAAGEVIDRYLPDEAEIKPGTVSISAEPFDGWVSIDYSEDTTAQSPDGLPVNRITIVAGDAPSDAYKDYSSVLAFEILPTGTIFSNAVTLRFSYLVRNIPEGVGEEDLVLGMWDAETGSWTILPSYPDLGTHSISTSVSHLTLFAVLAPRSS
jgi:hypothetical protein